MATCLSFTRFTTSHLLTLAFSLSVSLCSILWVYDPQMFSRALRLWGKGVAFSEQVQNPLSLLCHWIDTACPLHVLKKQTNTQKIRLLAGVARTKVCEIAGNEWSWRERNQTRYTLRAILWGFDQEQGWHDQAYISDCQRLRGKRTVERPVWDLYTGQVSHVLPGTILPTCGDK